MAPNHKHVCLYWGFFRRGQGGRAGYRTRLVPWTHQKHTSPWKDSQWKLTGRWQASCRRTRALRSSRALGRKGRDDGGGPCAPGWGRGRRGTLRERPLGSGRWEPHGGDPDPGSSPGTDQRGWRGACRKPGLCYRGMCTHTRVCVCVCVWNHVWLFATPWTAAHQAPLSMGTPGKNAAVGHHALLQRLFPTQGSILRLPHCRRVLYRRSHRDARESAALTLRHGALRPGLGVCCSSSGLRLAERGGARSRLGLSVFISSRVPTGLTAACTGCGKGRCAQPDPALPPQPGTLTAHPPGPRW